MSGQHPCLSKEAQQNPGIYTPNVYHKDNHKDLGYCTVGEKYIDPSKMFAVNPRYRGKQFATRPLLNKSAGKGYFDAKSAKGEMTSGAHGYMKGDTYTDKSGYLKTQPLDSRKLGFGSHDAAKRDEFMDFIRTEQYRQQLKTEKGFMDKASAGKQLLTAGIATPERSFPAGRTEVKHLYDIGRGLETEFDPKSSRDCFYNNLMCKSRTRPDRRTGGQWTSGSDVGMNVNDVTVEHPAHGHTHATKQFYDKSHLGSPLRR